MVADLTDGSAELTLRSSLVRSMCKPFAHPACSFLEGSHVSLVSPMSFTSESSSDFATFDDDRLRDVVHRQKRVAGLLERLGHDAVLMQRPENVAWFTAGGDVSRFGSTDATAALLVTPEARVVVTNNVDSPTLFERELNGLGFQLKERPWYEAPRVLREDVCRGRSVVSDVPLDGTAFSAAGFDGLRLPLSQRDCARLRRLGRIVAHAIEATCRGMSRGETELDVAGQLAHRLVRHGASVERLQVNGDGRADRRPHRTPSNQPVTETCVVAAVARRWGLHVGATRVVCFGPPDESLVRTHRIGSMVLATATRFARDGWTMADVWSRIERIYDKFGEPDAWHSGDQGTLIGYAPREAVFAPNGETTLSAGVPIHWHPVVGPVQVGDTVLVGRESNEILTRPDDWPRMTIEVKGTRFDVPGIFCREV